MPLSLKQFVRQLVDSGLLTDEAVRALLNALPSNRRPEDGEQLARELIRQKKLTAYQARAIYQGKGKGLVLGSYVILDKLGEGGMGTVFKAEHRRMERLVAIKVVNSKALQAPDAVKRFYREVKAAAKLNHPNIVTAYDANETGGTHFLVMEYVEGDDLSHLVKQQGPLPVSKAVACILQAARGLEYAHRCGVIHRDIKPSNLLLDRQGTVKILDMGLARFESPGGDQTELTGTGQIMGTIDYMAPEQALDTRQADHRADIYSLGIALWYLLTGRVVYEAETVMARLLAHREKPIPFLSQACPAIPLGLEAVFRKMVAKSREERYPSMTEVIADLQREEAGDASSPFVAPGSGEKTRWSEFVRDGAANGSPLPLAIVQPVAASPERPARRGDDTLAQRGSQWDTDPQTHDRLEVKAQRPRQLTRPRPRPVRFPVQWRDWRVLSIGGTLLGLALLGGIIVIIRNQRGEEVARLTVPEGGTVEIRSKEPPIPTPAPASEADGGTVSPAASPATVRGIPAPAAKAEAITSRPALPRLVRVDELCGMADDCHCWLTPDGRTIYFSREGSGAQSGIYRAQRPAADRPFGPVEFVLSARHMVLTSDERTLVAIGDAASQSQVIVQGQRGSIAERFGPLSPVLGLDSEPNPKSPWLSADGTLLVFQRVDRLGDYPGGPSAGRAGTEFVLCRRSTREAPWSAPARLPLADDPLLTDALTWPMVTEDLLTLFFCNGGHQSPEVMVARRSTADSPFGKPRKVLVDGQPLKGRAPRYVAATRELFVSRKLAASDVPGDLDLWVLKEFDVESDDAGAAAWTELFDGKGLGGWTSLGYNGWRVEQGILIGETLEKASGWLMSDQEFSDFELDLEYRLAAATNSGVFLRAWPEGDVSGGQFVEVQLLDDDAPAFERLPPLYRNAALWNQAAPKPTPVAPPGLWHRLRIRVVGQQVRISLNGIRLVDCAMRETRATGRIGLQLFHPTRIDIRQLRVRPAGP